MDVMENKVLCHLHACFTFNDANFKGANFQKCILVCIWYGHVAI